MNDITKRIVSASFQPVTDDMFEDPTPEEELEKEVALAVAIEDPEEKDELNKYRESEYDDDGYSDPYSKHKFRSAEAEIQDRFITIPLRPKKAKKGSLWITETDFIDHLALLGITKSEQQGLLRQWADIQILYEGEGNEDLVDSEQNEMMIKIVTFKSRADTMAKGLTERVLHVTNKTIADNTVSMPKSEQNRTGFVNQILGRKIVQ